MNANCSPGRAVHTAVFCVGACDAAERVALDADAALMHVLGTTTRRARHLAIEPLAMADGAVCGESICAPLAVPMGARELGAAVPDGVDVVHADNTRFHSRSLCIEHTLSVSTSAVDEYKRGR